MRYGWKPIDVLHLGVVIGLGALGLTVNPLFWLAMLGFLGWLFWRYGEKGA